MKRLLMMLQMRRLAKGADMNNYGKVALMVFALLYAASPVDMAVGPVDDMIVLLLTMILERRGAKLIK